jgi:hypothetical protein
VSALALALAAKITRRSLISTLRRAMAKRWSSGVALVSPLGCRRKGFPIANGGLVARRYHFARSCARGENKSPICALSFHQKSFQYCTADRKIPHLAASTAASSLALLERGSDSIRLKQAYFLAFHKNSCSKGLLNLNLN